MGKIKKGEDENKNSVRSEIYSDGKKNSVCSESYSESTDSSIVCFSRKSSSSPYQQPSSGSQIIPLYC